MKFDLIIVYSNSYLNNPDNISNIYPFNQKYQNYNDSYAFFLNYCQTKNLNAAFAAARNIIGPGKFKSYWVFKNRTWLKVNQEASSNFIFDKFTPLTEEDFKLKQLLYSSEKIKPFNTQKLSDLFKNKLTTYTQLSEYSIPTVQIPDDSKTSVQKSVDELNKIIQLHPNSNDFSNQIVLKDQFGLGGNNVFKIEIDFVENIYKLIKEHPHTSFVIQPFVKYQNGNLIKNVKGFVDIRVIVLNSEIIQSYIRIAKKGDFRCNTHQGGTFKFIKKIPKDVLAITDTLINKINSKNSFYALDFIKSDNGNIYLVEGNNNPGITWDKSNREDDTKTKLLIHKIIRNIQERLSN